MSSLIVRSLAAISSHSHRTIYERYTNDIRTLYLQYNIQKPLKQSLGQGTCITL